MAVIVGERIIGAGVVASGNFVATGRVCVGVRVRVRTTPGALKRQEVKDPAKTRPRIKVAKTVQAE